MSPSVMGPDVALQFAEFLEWLRDRHGQRPRTAITGGEPLAEAERLVLYSSQWGSFSDITLCTTAAIPLSSSEWSAIGGAGVNAARVSIHSTRGSDAQRWFGNPYDLGVVRENLRRMRGAGIALEVNYVLTTASADEGPHILEFCAREGIQRLRVLGLARQGRASKNWTVLKLPSEEEQRRLKCIADLCMNAGLPVDFAGFPGRTNCTHASEDGRCLGGLSFFHIATDGCVYPCPSVKALRRSAIGLLKHRSELPSAVGWSELPMSAQVDIRRSALEMMWGAKRNCEPALDPE